MAQLKEFIAHARQNNLSDEEIRDTLLTQGWSSADITLALASIEVPVSRSVSDSHKETTTSIDSVQTPPSLHPLLAALHHVLLWFFVGASTIAIIGAVSSLFGGIVSSEALAAMIAVSLITFTPYALLYLIYLRSVRHRRRLVPGKIWSIITVCLHSIGAMGAAITLTVALITSSTSAIIISAALILLLNSIIVITYIFSTFILDSGARLRKSILLAHIPLLTILLGALFILSVLQLGPAQADEERRKEIVRTVDTIRDASIRNQKLPDSSYSLDINNDIEYTVLNERMYRLCTNFLIDTANSYGYESSPKQPISDSYVDEYQFRAANGRQCFHFEASGIFQPVVPPRDTTEPENSGSTFSTT